MIENQSNAGTKRALLFGAVVVTTFIVVFVLVRMFENKQAARTPFIRVADVNEMSVDPEPWGDNWPDHYDGWKSTAGDTFYGGSSAMPASKLEKQPWLKRLYAGYAFSIDYRKARGHAYMLYDQGVTQRITKRPQAGACLHCHASTNVLYRTAGLEAMGETVDESALSDDFNWPAVMRGFHELSRKPYFEVLQMLRAVPDGTADGQEPVFPQPPDGGFTGEMAGKKLPEGHEAIGNAHPVTCIDCHQPDSMKIRVTRPGFVLGIQDLAKSDAPVPHLPSIERWRRGSRKEPYDPNKDATRQEMRSYVCAQCHVEYYCANKMSLMFPWGKGLRAEDLEAVFEDTKFPDDGEPFFDYKHGETGAKVYKVQHPEFELWSQGTHAKAGVSCADCHMPYERKGALKISSHHVRSPMENVNAACQTCHHVSEADLKKRVKTIQTKTVEMTERAAVAMTDMLDAIMEAKASGVTDEQLKEVFRLQRKSMWRLDYISSENSKGFHADQEAMRILGESIDYSRKAQALAIRLRAPKAPSTSGLTTTPIQGVTEGDAPSKK
ncbi:MAG: ammonia-forming cytochrome c nitrite reductase subunit c552 [Planctomycetota bacterium]